MDTFSQRPSLSPSSLVFSDRENRRSRCTPAPGPRVARGVYLSNDAFEGIEALWQAEHLVAQARIYAEALRPGAQFQCLAMTMSSALILYGIDTWFRNPPVLYRAHSASGRTWLLPEVPTPFGIVPATESKAVVLTRRRETALQSPGAGSSAGPSSDRVPCREVVLERLEQVAVDIARFAPPVTATADVSMILARLSSFDRRDLASSRRREQEWRQRLLKMNSDIASRHRRKVAEAVIKAADAGVDSHAEGALRWVLLNVVDSVLLRRWFGETLTSQHEVHVGSGRYYIDMALPKLGVAIEFEGMGKLYGEETDGQARVRNYFLRREALVRVGWTYIAVTYKELSKPVALASRLQQELSRLRVPVRSDISALGALPHRAMLA